MKDISTVWSRAAHAIETFGWAREVLGDSHQGVCLYGGLLIATGHSGMMRDGTVLPTMPTVPDPLVESCTQEIEQALGPEVAEQARVELLDPVPFWNDQDGRTEADVLDLLRELHEKELAERGLM